MAEGPSNQASGAGLTAPHTSVLYAWVCDHAFVDSGGKPCIIGLLHELRVESFPHHRALLTVASVLASVPDTERPFIVQFGPTFYDVSRQAQFRVRVSASGRAFLPFQMPLFRFDHPGDYVARLIDVLDGDRVIPLAQIKVVQGSS